MTANRRCSSSRQRGSADLHSRIPQDSYAVIEAGNGMEALETTQNTTIDLVISDVVMPVMDGLPVQDAKNDDRTSHIR
jgi:YesN/AraC family two-component response regulator